jgi:hypothetical protein
MEILSNKRGSWSLVASYLVIILYTAIIFTIIAKNYCREREENT